MPTTSRALFPCALALAAAACDATPGSGPAGADAGSIVDVASVVDAPSTNDLGAADAPRADVAADLGTDAGPVDVGPAADAPSTGCAPPTLVRPGSTSELVDGVDRATVTLDDPAACVRTYQLRTTATLRDGQPANPRTVHELSGWPVLRSGHDLFDALYAQAIAELREDSVASISDGSFDHGAPIACPAEGCFETGRLWTYVWTRDTSFATDLALGAMDPLRARNSLLFKVSPRRSGASPEVVQDTGTGGSWPVSSDRVVWALGASRLLDQLDGGARTAFRDTAYGALVNMAERDRTVVFDARDGLYRGEQSFLDWREQTYPNWVAQDPVHIAMSRSLGTNVLHFAMLTSLASMATERADAAAATRYQGWADALRTHIQQRFWMPADGQFAAFVTTELDPAPVRRWDALATALTVLTGVATADQARQALASYPHAGRGLAVIWPQQQFTPIYHNRASWPFVTAYWLRAARAVRNDASVDWNVASMVRAAALNLSNMENFEFATGRPQVDDGAYSGPVVDSQRQLWSVAGYLSMVHDVVFGIETSARGIRFRPYVTRAMRASWFGRVDRIELRGFLFRGRHFTVRLALPAAGATTGGAYAVGAVRVGAMDLGADFVDPATLADGAVVDVTLVDAPEAAATIRHDVDLNDWHQVFGPRTPSITSLGADAGGHALLVLDPGGEDRAALDLTILRDGVRVATLGPADGVAWTDPSTDAATVTHCYSVESAFHGAGTASQHASPQCWWGAGAARVQQFDASTFTAVGGTLVQQYGRTFYQDWGDPGSRLQAPTIHAAQSGTYLVQAVAGNGAGPVNTGITCGLKRLRVLDAADGSAVATGYIVMPQVGAWDQWRDSSFVRAQLQAGRSYQVVVDDDDASVNMSAFSHFTRYTGGNGGASGAFARVNIAALKLLFLGP